MPMKQIKKAVFPVAGLGTRFLPATKASPKEMLPIVDKPLIQYAVEEAIAAGMDQMIFITGRSKRAIADHFDKAFELEHELEAKGKEALLQIVRSIVPDNVACIYLRQPEALGLGHAVLCALPVVGNEPFAVILADDLIDGGKKNCMQQMVDVYRYQGRSVLGVERVPKDQTKSYGIVKATQLEDRVYKVDDIVEKPAPDKAPSNLAVVGRYILTPHIFDKLTEIGVGTGGEIQLTDAIEKLLRDEQVLAYEFEGRRYDCGSKLGYLEATVEFALKHPELKDSFRHYLSGLTKDILKQAG